MITALFTIFVCILLVKGCGIRSGSDTSVTASSPHESDLDDILERGKLVVLTENSSTSFFIYRGQPMGFEYEVLSEFAEYLGVELEIKIVDNMDSVFNQLNRGEADLIACNLTITKERSKIVNFTTPYLLTKQVLVQRKPDYWDRMPNSELEEFMVSNTIELIDREVHVRENSSFYERLINLSNEIGGQINIISTPGEYDTESLIAMVAEGEIQYTVADENVAMINQTYYENLDVSCAISFPQQIAWAVRKSSPDLLKEMDKWLDQQVGGSTFNTIYNRYFREQKAQKDRFNSSYSTIGGEGHISEYDSIIKVYCEQINWDWRLVASLIYQESRFNPDAVSWAGAFGLMQLMPGTAERYGIDASATPEQNLYAGIHKLYRLDEYWKDIIEDPSERVKFILASYNAGVGHVNDARRLATKYGKSEFIWDNNVAEYLLLKSKAQYYMDEVVQYGYCRGAEPYNYVKEILTRYDYYQKVIL